MFIFGWLLVYFGTLSFRTGLKRRLLYVSVWSALPPGTDRIKRFRCVFGLLGYHDPVQAGWREIAERCRNIRTNQEQRHSEVIEYGWLNCL